MSTLLNKDYSVEPWTEEITLATGNDSLFLNTHPYHTKLPPSIITSHIEHYTDQGDVVLDLFSGSGMTGVSAILNNRRVLLNDLSPAACHIANGYLQRVDSHALETTANQVIQLTEQKISAIYKTTCSKCSGPATIAYVIWSDIFSCPTCSNELNYWDQAVKADGSVSKTFICPTCKCNLTRTDLTGRRVSTQPVITVVDCMNACKPARSEHRTTEEELKFVQNLSLDMTGSTTPIIPMMGKPPGTKWGEQWRSGYHEDVTHVHHFFTTRNYIALSSLYSEIAKVSDESVRNKLLFAFTGSVFAVSRMVKYLPSRGGRSNLPGTLYISSLNLEQNVLSVYKRRLQRVLDVVRWRENTGVPSDWSRIEMGSAANLHWIKNDSVDYIFTDPPFGANIQYAELNFIHESWLASFTNTNEEIVINSERVQGLERYINLLHVALKEMYRVLKVGRYASLVFHNTDPKVWIGLVDAILKSGFSIENVTSIDKGKGGWNQTTSSNGTARYDIVLHLQKTEKPVQNADRRRISDQEILDHIEAELGKFPIFDKRKRTTPYIHSMTLRYLLTNASITPPPKMAKLESLLNTRFKQLDGAWNKNESSL